jgi:hypothetical protein
MKRQRETLGWIGLMVAIACAASGEDEKKAFRLGQKVRARFARRERHDGASRELVHMVAEAVRKSGRSGARLARNRARSI